ncbi:MAG: hypothetical protein FXF47_02680 [Candidatus Mcinerneyibacterium aminivorans]|uniref:Uncharacterized protein n=1 Tax=Candidatus Mcinerneyibacterium aminivorans TaxID=2703815 RepID=A0A5D0MIP4_9BACT|nr:MAG: hypothetical protein FXF47_02680 [Candidatus Mcinerneyibacterium aminivorans]
MISKFKMQDLKKLRNKIKELEDFIIDLETIPHYKKYKQVRQVRQLQNEIEKKLKEIGNNLELCSTKVKFNFESISNSYRLKKGKHEKQINKALFNKNVATQVLNNDSDEVKESKPKYVNKKNNTSEDSNLDRKIDKILSKIDIDSKNSEKYKKKIKNKINSVKNSKKYRDYKIKIKVGKNQDNKPKINLKLVKKNGQNSN